MNIKVARTMLILCCIYIIGFYILKFIFPEKLLLIITDTNILNFGAFIEQNLVFTNIYYFLFNYLTFYLFVCASKGGFRLKWYEALYIFVGVGINMVVTNFAPEFMVHTSTSLMFLLALLCKGKLLNAVVAFVVHGYLSQFLFNIRGFETIIYRINIASSFVLATEGFIWLVLFALTFYLMEKRNGIRSTTLSRERN